MQRFLHSLNPPHSLIHQSNPPHSPQPTHRLTHPHLSPLQNTPTYLRASIQLHTLIYIKQHTGPLDFSREGGVSARQVERTPGRATLTYWVVGPLYSYTKEGLVDNNNIVYIILFTVHTILLSQSGIRPYHTTSKACTIPYTSGSQTF